MRQCEDCPVSIEGTHRNTKVCPECKAIRRKTSMKKYRDKPEAKELAKKTLSKYLDKPENKERRQQREATPEYKAAKKRYSQTPEARARKKIVNHRYNTKPEVRERYRLRGHDPQYRKWQLEYARRYSKTEKGRAIRVAASQKRRAIKRSVNSTLTVEQVMQLRKLPCEYCKDKGGTVDHVIPISREGQNTVENCVPACLSCNSSKGNKTADEFIRWREHTKSLKIR